MIVCVIIKFFYFLRFSEFFYVFGENSCLLEIDNGFFFIIEELFGIER